MARLVECVPNFSEGRRPEVIEAILAEIRSIPGVLLLDAKSDASHNRTVVTFVGEPEAAKQAAFAACARAAQLINMEEHHGEHPRIGATDVIPFIPVTEVTMAECVELARSLGREIAEKLGIPVYLYEEASTRPHLKTLPQIRKGEYEGLKEAVRNPERWPDFGPHELHPTAGATVVGAREFLIAFNVNLGTDNVDVAKKIAKAIRESSGGYKNVKALGVMIEERGQAQVTINMCNYRTAPLYRIFETIKSEAARYGVNVVGSEIVGLTPLEALVDVAAFYLRLEDFKREQILEERLWEQGE
ncbi:MAG: glutamate formiminotransferase / 5-formyltetrahydrofolate cyclo-ligase [Bacillota bacterium]|nr:glutamate formiminotransferase / 5-formyltetrahydrofolate cyclo-ligase [Bacillota bacterium]